MNAGPGVTATTKLGTRARIIWPFIFIVVRSLTPSTRRTTETRLAAALSGNIRAKREGERRILARLSEQVGRRKKLQVESRFSRPQTEGQVLAAVDFMSQNTGTLEGDYLPR